MKGDLSRETFDRARHYSAVRLQQGRVVTDADWNEQGDLTRYRTERQARDTIGACGAPLEAAGYGLVAETNALAVHAVSANVAWIAAEDGVLLRTANGGAGWTLVDLNTPANLFALAGAGGTGWAAGEGGVVRKTSNQGTSWIAQNSGTFDALRGLSVFDADHAWAVGDNGTAIATSDSGATWRRAVTGAARLHAVHFIDPFAGLAVGQAGAIVATSDGGQSWTAVASGTTAHLRALAAFGTTLAWAAGQGGTIIRSHDAGATWAPCNTPSDATLYAIGFRDAHEGWAAGEGGVVLHTTDGGVTWSLEHVGTQDDLRGVSFFGGDPGWLVGDASTALRVGGGSPDLAGIVLPAVNLSIEPGRCYVNGTLCELEARTSYAHQADGGATGRLAPGAYMMYLDAWQRHVSAFEAPAIREVALGGPDTATRARTVAQVRALALPASSPFDWNCGSTIAAWDALANPRRPLLTARSEPQLAAAGICDIAATAGYRRLENQLYRVEVHDGGANPTFKWSRENGSTIYPVVSVSIDNAQQTTVRLAARGRDSNLDLAAHDRVELIDDDAELTGRAGVFFEYLNDGDDELELVLAGVPTGALGQDPSRHPILRRWDHKPTASGRNVLPIVEGVWIELEDGVQVRFGPAGGYRPGDYWQIPARTITADVEWPRNDDGDPVPRPPAGIADAYCRLGIVEVAADGDITVVSDCRQPFPPLTAIEHLLYVSGDGQDAAPNALLPQPLEVRVARGTIPLPGRTIRFEVETGGGKVGGGWQFEAMTDPDGHAMCNWQLGPGATTPARFQRVRASLLDSAGQPLPGQFVVFCATASLLLRYVSGDGQEGAPGAVLAFPLEVQVANGADGIAGAVLHATVQGGGSITGSAVTGPQGRAAFNWRLGATPGPQRVRVELSPGHYVVFCATASLSLRYVSGDGQDGAPGAVLAFPLEVQVVNGAAGIAGAALRATVDKGNGLISPPTLTSGLQGQAAFNWQLGASGPQRVRVELIDANGQVIQRLNFDATVTVATRGCEVTIGKGGDFEALDVDLLHTLFDRGAGNACVCFLPGTHTVPEFQIDGTGKFRLSLHGCGHTAVVNLRGPLTFAGFAALELRDLAIRAEGETGILFQKSDEVRVANILLDRPNPAKIAALSIVSARSVSVTGCEILTKQPTMAVMFQDISGDCRVAQNRFVGRVSFYGESTDLPTLDQLVKLAAIKEVALTPNDAQLTFCSNDLSQLAVATKMVDQLITTRKSSGVFASSIMHGNTFRELNSVFVAGLLGFATNAFTGVVLDNSIFAVMLANRITAVGNLATKFDKTAVLQFVPPLPANFEKAANEVFVLP
jgi:photosystem II stability/assembly factor-like uncharacterized protein